MREERRQRSEGVIAEKETKFETEMEGKMWRKRQRHKLDYLGFAPMRRSISAPQRRIGICKGRLSFQSGICLVCLIACEVPRRYRSGNLRSQARVILSIRMSSTTLRP